MNFFENITFRKKPKDSTKTSLNGTNANSTSIDGSTDSLPDISADDNTLLLQQLKLQIEDLTTKLDAAHEEINYLSLQNNELKRSLREVTSKGDILQKQTAKSKNKITPNKKLRLTTPPSSSQDITPIKQQNDQARTTSTPLKQITLSPSSAQSPQQLTSNDQDVKSKTSQNNKNKLCILNTENKKGSLSIIEDTFSKHFDFCHHIMHNCSTKILVQDIDQKLENFTIRDYCIIFIGQTDVKEENKHLSIINELKDSLCRIKHTNIILCLPTYVTGAPIYNYKAELFGKLLCLAFQNNDSVYLFDTNYYLTLEMFSVTTGKINKLGLKNVYNWILDNILVDLKMLSDNPREINKTLQCNLDNTPEQNKCEDPQDFFRLQ
ncbi:hypothetical protein B5X24_HaOG207339 [Helicoverpa armigera]|uniref:Uncharacterized protein n=1 Tax=Helicoverpa armigera TaxID=29058 RepID=A0A2W1BM71_HELAM|nr:hypothetical protein B5X24_HaOG207339 [Helicoverpa armigera]